MVFPTSYVLPGGELSILHLTDVHNPALHEDLMSLLSNMGLAPRQLDDLIILEQVGAPTGNQSVTIILDLVELNGRGTLLLQAFLGEAPPCAEVNATAVAGVLAQHASFGGLQVRTPDSGPDQVWLTVPMMQQDLGAAALQDALTLLATEADFLDDLIARTWVSRTVHRCNQCHADQIPALNSDGVYMWDCTSCGEGLSWLPDNPSPEYLAAWKDSVNRNWLS